MPRDCAFCKIGVMSVCAEPGCDNYICPTHTTRDGRCLDQFGVASHSVPVDSSPLEESPLDDEDDQKAASPASTDESSDDEPSMTEPSAAPRRRRKRTSKSAS